MKQGWLIAFGLIGLFCLFLLDLMVGSVPISSGEVVDFLFGGELEESHQLILYHARLPRAITAILCGMALSVAGLQMQTLFRNPLAGPYILGISSGAGLGVAILLMGSSLLGLSVIGDWSLALAAFMGSFMILFILFLLSLKVKDVMTLLILGIMVGAIATAFIGILQFFSDNFQLKSFILWSLGSLDAISYDKLKIMTLLIFLATALAFVYSKSLNALLMGEDFARSIGIKIKFHRLIIILSTGILAGTVTAYCGPIGFIGIIVPHLNRLIFKTNDHFKLIPLSMILGSMILLIADILSHLLAGELSLPINSITALIGIPIIIWILLSRKRISHSF